MSSTGEVACPSIARAFAATRQERHVICQFAPYLTMRDASTTCDSLFKGPNGLLLPGLYNLMLLTEQCKSVFSVIWRVAKTVGTSHIQGDSAYFVNSRILSASSKLPKSRWRSPSSMLAAGAA